MRPASLGEAFHLPAALRRWRRRMTDASAAEHRRLPLYLAATGGLLTATILLARAASDRDAPMLWFLAAAMTGAGLVELAAASLAGQLGADWRRVLAYSLGSGGLMAGATALAYTSVGHVGAGYVAFAHALPIMLTWVLARLLGLEGRSPRRLVAAGLGLAGGTLMAAAKFAGAPQGGAGWVAAASVIPLLLAIGNVYRTRFWPPGAPPLLLAALMLLAAAAFALPLAMALEGPAAAAHLTTPAVLPVLAAMIAAYGLQYPVYFRLQRIGGPLTLSLIGPIAGVLGPLAAVALFAEALPAVFPLAAALTGLGVWLMLGRR